MSFSGSRLEGTTILVQVLQQRMTTLELSLFVIDIIIMKNIIVIINDSL